MEKFSDYFLEPSKNGISKKFVDTIDGARIVNMKELFASYLLTDSIEMRRVELSSNEIKRFGLIKGDILFGRRSLVEEGAGKSTLYWGESPTVFESSIIRVRLNQDLADPKFVNYYFQSPVGKGKIWGIIAGTAVFGIRGSDLANIRLKFPPLPIQKKIAHILSAYDDLIENNNQRIRILEEIASELYKEWFVRFRFPDYQSATFVDKEGKEVPHGTEGALPLGWEMKSVGALYEVKSGFAFSSSFLGETGVPIIKIRNIGNYKVDTINCDRYSGKVDGRVEKFELFKGDLLIAMTGATVGKVSLFPRTEEKYYLNQGAGKFFPKVNLKNQAYIYQFSKSNFFKEMVINYALGAAQPNISGSQIEGIKMVLPTQNILDKYNEIVGQFYEEIFTLKSKNKILKQTRDLLLPRLISGKLSVEDLNIEMINKEEVAIDG